MSPLVLPIIQGVVELYKSRQHRKENLQTKTTIAAGPVMIAAGAVAVADQSLESLITSAVMAVVSLILFVWKNDAKTK